MNLIKGLHRSMGDNERGVLLAVLHFKSALSSKTFLCTTFTGNYCYSNEWSQAAWAFEVLSFISPFSCLTSYLSLCWLPIKGGCQRAGREEVSPTKTFSAWKGEGYFSPFGIPAQHSHVLCCKHLFAKGTHSNCCAFLAGTRNVL